MIAKLSKVDLCRLCLDEAIKCPIHFFSECPALVGVRQELFKHSFPTQSMGQQYLCQVSELALYGSIQDLIERTVQNSNVARRNRHCQRQWITGVMAFGLPLEFIVLGNLIV